jgi:hypothetical protein
MAELLRSLWQRLMQKQSVELALSALYHHALTLDGGGIASYTTKLGLLKADYALAIAVTLHHFQAQS